MRSRRGPAPRRCRWALPGTGPGWRRRTPPTASLRQVWQAGEVGVVGEGGKHNAVMQAMAKPVSSCPPPACTAVHRPWHARATAPHEKLAAQVRTVDDVHHRQGQVEGCGAARAQHLEACRQRRCVKDNQDGCSGGPQCPKAGHKACAGHTPSKAQRLNRRGNLWAGFGRRRVHACARWSRQCGHHLPGSAAPLAERQAQLAIPRPLAHHLT